MKLFAAILMITVWSAQGADLTGVWEMTFRGGELRDAQRVKITEDGGQYRFDFVGDTFTGAPPQGDTVEFRCRDNGKTCNVLKGTLSGDSMNGEGVLFSLPVKWSARRTPSPPNGAPTRHEFAPTVFYREFSGSKEPALRIFPGDTVHTTTVDAGGRDERGDRRVFGGNPLTGPFYIEGAMPGDTLAVTFRRIRLNRDSAQSGDRVIGSALEPYFFRDQPKVEKFDTEWRLDREQGMGMLKNPTERLKNYRVPLRPMIGCVGVAPPGNQSFRAGYLGDWGGNLDFNEIREGTTVFLPVNVAGALLFVGDGHAAQGDGELAGDALETSMEVEFTVNIEQNTRLRQVRIENEEYVMFSGVANSLQEALQRATTGLSRFLEARYKLNPAETGIVLGTAIQYKIAEVVDPQVHVVAKLPRKALEGLRAEQ